MSTKYFINVADLKDPNDPQGRSYREINAEKLHNIPIGALVEITDTGVRLFVVHQGRDCDQTPLYWLSADQDDTKENNPGWMNGSWTGGYPEESLQVIKSVKSEH